MGWRREGRRSREGAGPRRRGGIQIAHHRNDLTGRPLRAAAGVDWRPRGALPAVGRAVLMAAALVVLASLVHELGHAVAAVALGVPASTLDIGFNSTGPYLALFEPLDGWRATVTNYAGGLPAGAAMGALYVFWWARWARRGDRAVRWWLGALVLVLVGNELANGFAEGALRGDYLAGTPATETLGLVGAALGFTAHRVLAGRGPPLLRVPQDGGPDGREDGGPVRREDGGLAGRRGSRERS